jgi:hypothetical protein
VYGVCITLWIAGNIAVIVSTMPVRHRERYCGSPRKLSTITPEFCPRCAGISVHVDVETLSTMSRNTQFRMNSILVDKKTSPTIQPFWCNCLWNYVNNSRGFYARYVLVIVMRKTGGSDPRHFGRD